MKITPRMLVGLPWTWEGPHRREENGAIWWELRIKELPGFFVAGDTKEVAIGESSDALEAWLQSMVDEPNWPPLPARIQIENVQLLVEPQLQVAG